MLALHITNLKQFMNHLLILDTFDSFLLEEAVITTANTYTIDGRINHSFYSEEDLSTGQIPDSEYSPWSTLKGICFQLIKGKRTPLSFKFVFHVKPEHTARLLLQNECTVDTSAVKSLVMTIRYDGMRAVLTTGCSYHTFVLSKEPELIWEKTLTGLLTTRQISYEFL